MELQYPFLPARHGYIHITAPHVFLPLAVDARGRHLVRFPEDAFTFIYLIVLALSPFSLLCVLTLLLARLDSMLVHKFEIESHHDSSEWGTLLLSGPVPINTR